MGVYYIALILVFAIGKLVSNWGYIAVHQGDIYYLLLLIWPLAGFGLGYLSAWIADKIVKFSVSD
jgi:hypothetical protein